MATSCDYTPALELAGPGMLEYWNNGILGFKGL
jgi:hypothetical protein